MQEGVLVLRGGALGDFVLSIPHLFALQERFGALTIATHRRYIPFLEAIELGKSFLPLDRGETTQILYADPPCTFDGVISWLKPGTDHPTVAGRRFSAFVSAGSETNVHVADAYWKSLEPLGIAPTALPDLRRSFRHIGERAQGTVALHPGSGGNWKRWPLESYLELARRLVVGPGVGKVLILVGPEDGSWHDEARAERLPDGVSLCESMDLRETASLLASACLYVGNDSGVTHLSALLDIPTIAIHGPTSSEHWGARGRRVKHVFARGPCPECDGGEPNNGRPHTCLGRVTPERVLEEASALTDACSGC